MEFFSLGNITKINLIFAIIYQIIFIVEMIKGNMQNKTIAILFMNLIIGLQGVK